MDGTTQITVMANAPPIVASGTARPSQWLLDALGGGATRTGQPMNPKRALSYSAVFQAISVLAGDIGQLPIDLFERTDERNKDKDTDHPSFRVVRTRANDYMSAGTFRETMMLYTLIYGNGVAEIEWSAGRRVKALWPLLPEVTHREIDDSGNLWYVTRVPNGNGGTEEKFLRPENVVHISNFGVDGTWGFSTITLARDSWGLGLAAENYASTQFRNNGTPSGVLETDRVMDDGEYGRLRRSWAEAHEGVDNAARVAILEQGTQFKTLAFSQKDSQWLESREFQREEVASWFNLPPHKLGVLKDANYSNMSEANRHYLSSGLMRWEVKWQDEYNEKLLSKTEKEEYSHFFEFNNSAHLRGDIKSQSEAYSSGLGGAAYLTQNEVRGFLNLNAVEDGDEIPQMLNIAGNDETVEGDEDTSGATASNSLVRHAASVRELLSCEANRVSYAARTARNYVEWLDAFYSRWAQIVSESMEREGVDHTEADVSRWVDAHKEECLEISGSVQEKEALVAGIAASTALWPGRCYDYIAQFHQREES